MRLRRPRRRHRSRALTGDWGRARTRPEPSGTRHEPSNAYRTTHQGCVTAARRCSRHAPISTCSDDGRRRSSSPTARSTSPGRATTGCSSAWPSTPAVLCAHRPRRRRRGHRRPSRIEGDRGRSRLGQDLVRRPREPRIHARGSPPDRARRPLPPTERSRTRWSATSTPTGAMARPGSPTSGSTRAGGRTPRISSNRIRASVTSVRSSARPSADGCWHGRGGRAPGRPSPWRGNAPLRPRTSNDSGPRSPGASSSHG